MRRPLNLFLQADDPAREALLEPETQCSSGMRSGAILLEPLLLDIGTDGLELLPEGLQGDRTDGLLLPDGPLRLSDGLHGAGCARSAAALLPVE